MSRKNIKNNSRKNQMASKRAAKKAAVLEGQSKRWSVTTIVLVLCGVLLAGGAAYFMLPGGNSQSQVAPLSSSAGQMDVSSITYPVAQFDDGKAQHFHYKADGIEVRYFILKSSDGILRAAFDACDVCWPAGKGYYQDGDDMVCRNCGRRFASVRINEVKGGCNPAPLDRSVKGDQLVLAVDDILDGKQYFNFSKRSAS